MNKKRVIYEQGEDCGRASQLVQ